MYMKQFLTILLMYALGYGVSEAFQLPLPANVLGLLFLLAALCLRIIRMEQVEQVADFIISHLALFFVAPVVGVMMYFDLFARSFLQIFVPLFASILAGFFVTGHITQLIIRWMAPKGKAGVRVGTAGEHHRERGEK